MKKLILLLLVIGGYAASGKEPGATTDLSQQPLTAFAPRSSANSESGVHFFYDIDLGYASMSATGPYAFKQQGAFLYGGDLGIRFNVHAKSSAAANHVSIAIGGYQANLSNFHSSTVRSLLTYTHFWCFGGNDDAGLFWQAGIVPTYLYTVTDKNNNDLSNHVNRIFVDPMVSFGIHTRFRLVSRRSGNDMGGGRVFVGPFFSYGIGNLSKDAGETINPGYKIGVRWSYVF